MNRPYSISILLATATLLALAAAPADAQTVLKIDQTSFSFSAPVGSTAIQEQPLFILTNTGLFLSYSSSIQQTGNWLSISPASGGTAPIAVQIKVDPTGLPLGTYNGIISVFAQGSTVQNVTVSLTVGTSTSSLTAAPALLSFSYTVGGLTPNAQTISVTSSTTAVQNFNVSATTDTGGNWLSANPASATTSAGTVTVAVNPAALGQGTYNGRVTLTPSGFLASPLTIPVTLTVSATAELKLSALQPFNYQTGMTPPASQTLSLTSTGASLTFSATVTTQTGGSWLVVSPISGATAADLTVSVNQSALSSLTFGTYSASIAISAPGALNPAVTVPVTLNVSTAPFLNITPASLSFTVQPGGALPQAQNLGITGTSTNIPFTASTNTAAAPNWLSVTPTSGTAPATLAVSLNANAQTLLPGTYNGSITMNAPLAATPVITIPVTLTVSNTPALIAGPSALFFNFQTGRSTPNLQTVLVSSSGIPAQFSVTSTTAKGGPWLQQVLPAAGTTPSILTVSVNPAGLTPDTYTGTITLTPTASGATPVTVAVTLTVSNSALLNVSPPVVSFNLPQGAGITSQNVGLTSTGDQVNFSATFATTSCGPNWMLVTPLSGTTPSNLLVYVVPGTLSIGVCTGTITVSATGANSQTIPVTLTVTSGATLRVEPGTLSFSQPQGGAAPAAQTVSLTASGATPVNFVATATTSSCGNWLTVDPVNGATPAQLRVSVSAVSVVAGTPCTGQITVQAPGATNSPLNLPVSLNVVAQQTLAVSPASLAFSYQVGATAPAAQSVQATSAPSAVNFTLASATQSGGDWLSATTNSGTTPATIGVGLKTQNLTQAGTFTGTVTLTSPNAGNSPLTIGVTVTVTAAPVPRITTVRNAASYVPGPVAPGEIVYIEGSNMGPAALTTLRLNSQGLVDTTLAETRVLFDGIPAPLVYVWFDRLSCIVPYSVAGRVTVRMQVEYRGQLSSTVEFQVTDAAPGVFTVNQQGSGQGAILNQDYSANGPQSATTRPAAVGSVVMVYATGEGQTLPAGVDGRVNSGIILPRPLLPVTATVGGRDAEVTYAGAAPNFVSGAMQINVRIPAGTPSGGAIPLTVQVGNRPIQSGVTLAVQ